MIKVTVNEFVDAMGVINYLLKEDIQKRLSFTAKDKLVDYTQYNEKLKNINIEKERLSKLFGEVLYELQQGVFIGLFENKLYELKEQGKVSKEGVLVELPKDSKMVVDFNTSTHILRLGDTFYNITAEKSYEKYMQELNNKEIRVNDVEPFNREDLAQMNEFSVADLLLLGRFYQGKPKEKKETKEDSQSFVVDIDKEDIPKKTTVKKKNNSN